MFQNLVQSYNYQIEVLKILLLAITALINVVFAGAVARDSGELNKIGQPALLVSGLVWAFATLVGGVFVAAVYWILHHSKLTRD